MKPLSCLLALLLTGNLLAGPAAETPGEEVITVLHPLLASQSYYHGKTGFPNVVQAKNHAYKEFLREVRQRRIDPSKDEFYSFIYTARDPGQSTIRYLHTPWEPATFLGQANGCDQYRINCPFPEAENLRKNTLLHSHPTNNRQGDGPSRMDVALASTYRNGKGGFRYLYLINNKLELIQYKAMRPIDGKDPAALRRMPVRPRFGLDWMN